MSGGKQSLIKITLRDPTDKQSTINYIIKSENNQLAQDWASALKLLLQNNNHLEKNYCFLGFPNSVRNVEYLCNELNRHIKTINLFNFTNIWQNAGLKTYIIEEYFCEQAVRFNGDYPCGDPVWDKFGHSTKHGIMNSLHNHFERLQGTVWNLSSYYQLADLDTKYAIRQLNNICHELENIILSQRKRVLTPQWIRPSQITTFLHAPRYNLTDEHRQGFLENRYDRVLGGVYMHWAQIGKTLFEVWRDEGAPDLNIGTDPADISVGSGATCEAINALKFYSGEFDIEWGNDIVDGEHHPWHTEDLNRFKHWLNKQGVDYNNPRLSLGYLKIGQVDLNASFGTTNYETIWNMLGTHSDIYSIEVDDIKQVYDYCWSDPDHEQRQKETLRRLENVMD